MLRVSQRLARAAHCRAGRASLLHSSAAQGAVQYALPCFNNIDLGALALSPHIFVPVANSNHTLNLFSTIFRRGIFFGLSAARLAFHLYFLIIEVYARNWPSGAAQQEHDLTKVNSQQAPLRDMAGGVLLLWSFICRAFGGWFYDRRDSYFY